ncbi:hypothetical protein L208DRAFT_1167637, partial [Tricholoma matsutake]
MNMVNISTGLSPCMLKMGRSPCLLPPLPVEGVTGTSPADEAMRLATTMLEETLRQHYSLLTAKISQARHANSDCAPDPAYEVGDHVMLAMARWRHEYMQSKDGHVAK